MSPGHVDFYDEARLSKDNALINDSHIPFG
jgi:hypothetical protein